MSEHYCFKMESKPNERVEITECPVKERVVIQTVIDYCIDDKRQDSCVNERDGNSELN